MDHYIEQLVDLTDPAGNQIYNMTMAEARERVLRGTPDSVREIAGSFALVARDGKMVRLARSLDRPMRYFLAKRAEGPALIVADRIDAIHNWLATEGLADQFHPSYTRMVPAHYVVEIQLVGCPDPDPVYTRFFDPPRNQFSTDLDGIGRAYIGALLDEVGLWLRHIPGGEPIGVSFSGGIDSGAVFLATYHVLKKLGHSPSRLKAFTLAFNDGPDLAQAREFLERVGLSLFHEPLEADLSMLDVRETIRIVE
ncbi:MAG: asparagine synthase-related protein, partial [Verrucomicrobia subdivision 3 bacterium]|nr:asparagine synthase-related protein [Limisphaerales bacterium]